jgi:hypothetical protein
MKRLFIPVVCFFICIQLANGQVIFDKPLSPRQTGYVINASLKPDEKTVHGQMKAFWVNQSSDIVPDVWLHLYLNAFRSKNSTFSKEAMEDMFRALSYDGGIDVNYLTDREGNDLLKNMQYVSPDDNNPDDHTVARILLDHPANPGDTVFLNIGFDSKLPTSIIRTGCSGDFFFVAQWFPKFGVYEPEGFRYSTKGAWNCHQFHSNSEFYANHSVYDVKITVPQKYVVGSGGLLINEQENADKTKTLYYRAEDIVDFAWTAWPGYAVYNDTWKNVKITFMSPPERKDQVNRQFEAVKHALEYLDAHVGPYPWPHLTFVDPPSKGAGASGMEYTTIFTSESFYGIPDFLRIPELVTVHEFGHAYFMGIMASNEFEEPWLDEGINTFWENRIMDHYYGSGYFNHPLMSLSDMSNSRLGYITSENRQATDNSKHSWKYPHGTYSMMSYYKTATIFNTLMGIIGEENTDAVFREYYNKWAFRHPSGRDLINVVNDVMKNKPGFEQGLNWFFDETLYGTGICDYKVMNISNHRQPADSSTSKLSDSLYYSVIELERAGDLIFPVDVLVHFDNGDEAEEYWDGKDRTKDFNYTGKRRVVWVKIDPEYRIKMDVNYFNNSLTEEPDHVPVRRLINKFIFIIEYFITLITI